MRKKTQKLYAILLTMSMLMTGSSNIFAEEMESESIESITISATTYQQVEIIPEESSVLSEQELQYYNEITDEIKQNSNCENGYIVENDENYIVYSLNEGMDQETIIQAITYSSDEEEKINIVSYEEIVLPENKEYIEDIDNSNAINCEVQQTEIIIEEENENVNLQLIAETLEQENNNKNINESLKENTYENSYRDTESITISAEELLAQINDDDMAFEFAKRLGFGSDKETIAKNLEAIVSEYKDNIETFEEPRFIINGVDISLDKDTKQIGLKENSDGTYSVSTEGSINGYRTTINVDANASVTIVYDEKGETKIERVVKDANPTDFVITLDISGSMVHDGRDNAMLSALEVLIDEILSDERNTVSLVMFASNSAIVQLEIDSQGIKQTFSAADGITAKQIFDAPLVDAYGNKSGITLGNATISELENLYNTYISTAPNKGLDQAISLFEALKNEEDNRNKGVVLFTDGLAEPSSNEYPTIEKELELIKEYGTTIVNVTIGDENDVKQYERYLDPHSDNYYEKDNPLLQKQVLYYNIPKLSDKELADKVSEIFEVAFEQITTEKKELKTETITDGVLAAYGAKILETIPKGFELVQIKNNAGVSYEIVGKDENNNTIIRFNLNDLISGNDMTLSYCVIPTEAGIDLGVTSYKQNSETVLYTEPVNKIENDNNEREIEIIYSIDAEQAPHGGEIKDDPLEEKVETIVIGGKEEHQNASNQLVDDALKEVEKQAKEYKKLLEDFYGILKVEAENKAGGALDEIVDTEKFAEEIRKNGWIDIVLPEPFNNDEKAIKAAYKAIAKIYKQILLKTPRFSKIDFSNTSPCGMMMISSNIINMVKENLTTIDDTFVYDGYTITLNGTGMFSAASGKISITDKNGKKVIGAFSSSVEETQKIMNAYVEDLSKIVKDESKKALFEVLSELSDVTGLKDFFNESMEETIKNNIKGLEKAGFKKLMDNYAAMKEIYDEAKPIFDSLNNPTKLANAIKKNGKDLYETIKKLKIQGSSDWFNNDKAVKEAMNKIEKARKNLEDALFSYVYEGQTQPQEEKSVFEWFFDLFK